MSGLTVNWVGRRLCCQLVLHDWTGCCVRSRARLLRGGRRGGGKADGCDLVGVM